jgi:hypothetical protein
MICACVLLGNGSAELVSLKYPSDVDYTPRDTSDPYVGNDNPHRANDLRPRRTQEAEPRDRNLGELQENRASPSLNKASRYGGWMNAQCAMGRGSFERSAMETSCWSHGR